MKMAKKTGLLFVALSLVVAFSSFALAGNGYVTYKSMQPAVEKRALSAEEIKAKYAGVVPIPMPLPKFERPDVAAEAVEPHTGIPLKEYHDPANMPAGAYVNNLSAGEIVPRVGPCPASDWYQIFDTDYYAFPTMAVGKILFTGHDGLRYMCTGSVINDSLMLTAGHCVCGDGGFYYDFAFMPGYYYGYTPYETWTMNNIVVFEDYFYYTDYRYDVAFVILNNNVYGYTVGDYVGWLGFASGLDPVYEWWNEYGYPWNLADGEALSRVTSAFGTYDYWGGYPSNPTIGVGSNMLGGCSGGPWVRYDSYYGYQANGLNSYGYNDCNFTIFGPNFNAAIWDAYQYALSLQ